MGMGAIKLMTLHDEGLFKIGLRIIGLLLDSQAPDNDFVSLVSRVYELIK